MHCMFIYRLDTAPELVYKMDLCHISFLVIMANCVHIGIGQGISIFSTTQIHSGHTNLEVDCTPETTGIKEVNTIQIYKNGSDTSLSFVRLVSVSFNRSTRTSVINWQNTNLQAREGVNATGSVDSPATSHLDLTIAAKWTTCTDAAIYRCEMTATKDDDSNLDPPPVADSETTLNTASDCFNNESRSGGYSTSHAFTIIQILYVQFFILGHMTRS